MFSPGEIIGNYTILRHIGAGGMGDVYLGEHVHMGRKAAVKVLMPELSAQADSVARFFDEARATGRVSHPSIVEVLDCAVHPSGAAYIVMEYLAGESLGEYLERAGSLEEFPRTAAALTGQIADALAAAHDKGIIHRDLKPDNVFLSVASADPSAPINVKILDFGIAKLVGQGASEAKKTRTGSLLGTPLYMSPEQCRGSGRIDYRTDIYSLGCILFEAIAGRPPFVREGVGDLIVAHVAEDAPELSSIVPAVPAPLNQLVGRMLAKDPAARPSSMADVVREIESFLSVRSGGFLPLIKLPPAFPILAARDEGSAGRAGWSQSASSSALHPPVVRTQVMPQSGAPAAGSAGRTQLLPDQRESVRPTSSTTLVEEPRALPLQPKRRGVGVWFLAIIAILGGGGYWYVQRWGNPLALVYKSAEPSKKQREMPTLDPAAAATIAPFLQAGNEPPYPPSCRTSDPDSLNGLAKAARDLAPDASAVQRARGLAALNAVSDSVSERWIIEARATLNADPRAAEHASGRAVSLCAASAVAENLHGNALQVLQQVAPAEAAYRDAVRLAPDWLAPQFNLGLLQLRNNDAAAALAIFDGIARAKVDYPNIYLVRAEAHRRLGDRTAVTADLEEHVRRQPADADGWLQLGRALYTHDRRRARAAFCRAKSLGQSEAAPLCRG